MGSKLTASDKGEPTQAWEWGQVLNYEIDVTGANDSDEHRPKGLGLEATRAFLNDGRLTRMFEKYKTNKPLFPSHDYYVVILGALAMAAGATITTEQMELLHAAHKTTPVAEGYNLPIFDCGFRTEGAAYVTSPPVVCAEDCGFPDLKT